MPEAGAPLKPGPAGTNAGPMAPLRPGPALGGFGSRVASAGPELGDLFETGDQTGHVNVRAYREFWARNRLAGHAVFATIKLAFGA